MLDNAANYFQIYLKVTLNDFQFALNIAVKVQLKQFLHYSWSLFRKKTESFFFFYQRWSVDLGPLINSSLRQRGSLKRL